MKKTRKLVGRISVDAGLVYVGDPCYVIGKPLGATAWHEFLKRYVQEDEDKPPKIAFPIDDGTAVVVPSGYGDGSYPVYADVEDGIVVALTVDLSGEDSGEEESI